VSCVTTRVAVCGLKVWPPSTEVTIRPIGPVDHHRVMDLLRGSADPSGTFKIETPMFIGAIHRAFRACRPTD
jgi:hypothetical protein